MFQASFCNCLSPHNSSMCSRTMCIKTLEMLRRNWPKRTFIPLTPDQMQFFPLVVCFLLFPFDAL